MENVTLRFKNGAEIEVIENGTIFEAEPLPVIPDNLDGVKVILENGEVEREIVHGEYSPMGTWDGKPAFAINEIPYAEYQRRQMQAAISDVENAVCEESMTTDERLSDIENAICELSELIN